MYTEKEATETAKETPSYQLRIKGNKADALYLKIIEKLTSQKLYRDPKYNAKKLAADLGTNTRYIAAVVAQHTNKNYSSLINFFRLRDAKMMLRSKQHSKYTVEEIGMMAGYSSRQAFYLSFSKTTKMTPKEYREKYMKSE